MYINVRQRGKNGNSALAIFRNHKSFPRSFTGASVGGGLSVIDVVEDNTAVLATE